MKKALTMLAIFVVLFSIIVLAYSKPIYATNTAGGESTLIQIKESQAKNLEEYKEKYGSDTYGFTAYVLHLVQIYSIPFCFLGIVISIIYKVVLGARHLESAEKGLGMIVAIVTVTIICQVLPLIFAIVVKFGKG